MTAPFVITNAEVNGEVVDVRVEGASVAALGRDLTAPGDDVIDAGGAAVIPGLHDHHIHLLALVAAQASVMVGPPEVRDAAAFAGRLRHAAAGTPAETWVRAVGYHERVAGLIDRWALDAIVAHRPVRVQHRSGALWVLNSEALRLAAIEPAMVGLPDGVERDRSGRVTGRLWRVDEWFRDRIPGDPLDPTSVGRQLLRRGVTAVTDATPTEDRAHVAVLERACRAGFLPQRVVVTGGPALPPGASPELERGPVKLVIPDHAPVAFDDVVAGVRAARALGRSVAIHCVTRVAVVLALAALEEVGSQAGDRVEHGAVLPLDVAGRLAALGVTIVTNPGFVAERGDEYLSDVEAGDVDDLWRCRSLLNAGVAVGAGTDAPFASPDPWAAVAAACDRRTRSGRRLGPAEAVDGRTALNLFLAPLEAPGGPPRSVTAGAPADLCVLTEPLDVVLADPEAACVAATVRAGRLYRW